jgi:hypothetical protein
MEIPPKKSSICNILVGKRECKKRFRNISNIWIEWILILAQGSRTRVYLGPAFSKRVSITINDIEQNYGSELTLEIGPEPN